MGTKILTGNNMEKLREIESESIDCVVSSPPYFGLRDYGTGTWEGGDSSCPHKRLTKISKDTATGHAGMYEQGHVVGDAIYKQICPECGAKRVDDQFGLEETLEEYIEKTVLLFEELRRVLKPQGTVWWNLGDSYANKSSAWGGRGKNSILNNTGLKDKQRRNTIVPEGLKAKDLMMIPARVAIALSENGWYLRSEIIWHKPNPMPESVKDRPTSAHEKIYLFSKNKKYYYDADAIREKAKTKPTVRNKSAEGYQADYPNGKRFSEGERTYGNGYANKRNVWTVTTKPFKGAHFAVFPTDLIEPCIKAGCPKGGIVLDPFGGSGTTGFVANNLGRDAILIELNEEYVEIAKKRIGGDNPLFSEVEDG